MTNPVPNHDAYLFVINASALGDTVTTLPVIKYMAEKMFLGQKYKVMVHPHVRPLFSFVPEEHIIYFNVDNKFDEPYRVANYYDVHGTEAGPSSFFTPMRLHLVDYASIKLLGLTLEIEDKNYPSMSLDKIHLKKFKLPEKYVVLLTTVLDDNRGIPKAEMYKIAQYILDKGYTPVFVGKNAQVLDNFGIPRLGKSLLPKKGMIDLVDQTSVLEAAKIMSQATAVVGMDTGLIHLAAMSDVPIVCGYTIVKPELRMPFRHNELGWNVYPIYPKEGECRGCSSSWLINYVNFSKCYYKNNECLNSMTAENFICELEKILNNNG
jgi:ADP-heptose:LPS heptosyltransferase